MASPNSQDGNGSGMSRCNQPSRRRCIRSQTPAEENIDSETYSTSSSSISLEENTKGDLHESELRAPGHEEFLSTAPQDVNDYPRVDNEPYISQVSDDTGEHVGPPLHQIEAAYAYWHASGDAFALCEGSYSPLVDEYAQQQPCLAPFDQCYEEPDDDSEKVWPPSSPRSDIEPSPQEQAQCEASVIDLFAVGSWARDQASA